MARTKQHPDIGKYVARFEYHELSPDEAPEAHLMPKEAIAAEEHSLDEGDVVYVYQIVDVLVVRKPTLTEKYVP